MKLVRFVALIHFVGASLRRLSFEEDDDDAPLAAVGFLDIMVEETKEMFSDESIRSYLPFWIYPTPEDTEWISYESTPSSPDILRGSSPEGVVFSGIFTRSEDAYRDFILEIVIEENVYPVVFDTGSGRMWVASHEYAKTSKFVSSPLPLPLVGGDEIAAPGTISYMSGTGVDCDAWYFGTIHTGLDPEYSIWSQEFCVASKSSFAVNGFLGVLGVDKSSHFLAQHPIFWIGLSNGYVGLILDFSRNVEETLCSELPLLHVPLTRRDATANHWEFSATVTVGDLAPFSVHASPDTGVYALYVHGALWDALRDMWTALGFVVTQNKLNTRYYSKTGCDKIDSLAPITIKMGDEFTYTLTGAEYTRPGTGRCYFELARLPPSDGNLILIGSNILTKINTRFDYTHSRVSFCHPPYVT